MAPAERVLEAVEAHGPKGFTSARCPRALGPLVCRCAQGAVLRIGHSDMSSSISSYESCVAFRSLSVPLVEVRTSVFRGRPRDSQMVLSTCAESAP